MGLLPPDKEGNSDHFRSGGGKLFDPGGKMHHPPPVSARLGSTDHKAQTTVGKSIVGILQMKRILAAVFLIVRTLHNSKSLFRQSPSPGVGGREIFLWIPAFEPGVFIEVVPADQRKCQSEKRTGCDKFSFHGGCFLIDSLLSVVVSIEILFTQNAHFCPQM